MMQVDLAGRVAVVTGGGSGIGLACAQALAAAGAAVVVTGRTQAKLDQAVQTIEAGGGRAVAVAGDVSDGADVLHMVHAATAAFGRLDIVVCSAGISPAGRVTDISEAEWDTCLAIDLRSVFLAAKYAIPVMQAQGEGGALINIAGTLGIRPCRNKAAYAAAKAGVINLTRAIALDYAAERIRSNVICPGYIDTPLNDGFDPVDRDAFLADSQPLPGLIQAEDVASMALYLASDAAHMVTGQVFVIDGGQQAGMNR